MIIASTWVLIFVLWHLASIFAELWHLHGFSEPDFVITSALLCLVCRVQQFQRAFRKQGPHFHASSLLGKQWLWQTFLGTMAISLALCNTFFSTRTTSESLSLSIYWLVFSIYLASTTDLSMFLRGILVRISSHFISWVSILYLQLFSNHLPCLSGEIFNQDLFIKHPQNSAAYTLLWLPQHQSILAGFWIYSPGPDHAGWSMSCVDSNRPGGGVRKLKEMVLDRVGSPHYK